jgi:hypothetical protein
MVDYLPKGTFIKGISLLMEHQSFAEYRVEKLQMHFFCYSGHTIAILRSLNKFKIKVEEMVHSVSTSYK